MNRNKYLLLVSSLGVFVLLVGAAVEEHFLKEWRRIQRAGHNEDGPIPVQLRQVVNPALRTSDRCVSCHVSMAPGEGNVTGSAVLVSHRPVVHDPAEFGCTICHGGQGQATEKAAAHGEVPFWPEPMLPLRFSYAGCGTCHTPLGVPHEDLLLQARQAFQRLDCLACHRVDGRGGTPRPGNLGMEGPDLSRVGLSGYDREWYGKHLKKSREAAAGPWRTSFAEISESDLGLLRIFLDTRVAAPRLVEAKAAFHSSGCLGCHKVSGVGGDEGPELTEAGRKDPGRLDFTPVPDKPTLANWMAEHFRSPGSVVPDSQMPALGLSERQVELLTLYTLSLRRRDLPSSYVPRERLRALRFGEREFAADGATIFGAFCSGCHGSRGQGRRSAGMAGFPANAHPDFLAIASDEFLLHTVIKGRPGRRMPPWGEKEGGLRPEEIRQVVAYLRRLGGVAYQPDGRPPRWVKGNVDRGRRLFASACSGCHGRNGEGGEGPALNNPVLLATATDSYLVETIKRGRRGTAMEGFLTPAVTRPALSSAEIESVVAFLRSWEKPGPTAGLRAGDQVQPAKGESP
jgi:mono/diheme cytochrome c family protein